MLCFVTRFRQLRFKFVGHSSWAQDSNFVYWHSFSSKFQSSSSPRRKGPITLDEFEWQNTEFIRRNDEFDPAFLNRLATQTNFSDNCRIWMQNFNIWLTKHAGMWMIIWQKWTLDLNAISFSGRNWIENWWNWLQRWRKWAGKPILFTWEGEPVFLRKKEQNHSIMKMVSFRIHIHNIENLISSFTIMTPTILRKDYNGWPMKALPPSTRVFFFYFMQCISILLKWLYDYDVWILDIIFCIMPEFHFIFVIKNCINRFSENVVLK